MPTKPRLPRNEIQMSGPILRDTTALPRALQRDSDAPVCDPRGRVSGRRFQAMRKLSMATTAAAMNGRRGSMAPSAPPMPGPMMKPSPNAAPMRPMPRTRSSSVVMSAT